MTPSFPRRLASDLTDNEGSSEQYEIAAHGRGRWGGFALAARGGIAKVDFDGQRRFDAAEFSRVASADWGGTLVSGIARASYELALGKRLYVRRSEEHTSELQSLMRISYAVFCLKKQITSAHDYSYV